MFNKQIDDVLFLKMKHLNSKKLIQTSQIKKQKWKKKEQSDLLFAILINKYLKYYLFLIILI